MSDMAGFLLDAEKQAASMGLATNFRHEFARIVSYLAQETIDFSDASSAVIQHFDNCCQLVMAKYDLTTTTQVLEQLLCECNACLSYWDEGAVHKHVLTNVAGLFAYRVSDKP